MTTPSEPALPASAGDNERLVQILITSLQQLAAAGDVESACRLAGQACAATRRNNERAMHRFNVLLHRLCVRRGANRRQ